MTETPEHARCRTRTPQEEAAIRDLQDQAERDEGLRGLAARES